MRISGSFAAALAAFVLAGAAGCDQGGSRGRTRINQGEGRYGHTATVLPDGRVVVIGGVERKQLGLDVSLPSSLEVFDPATESFKVERESGHFKRAFHAAAYSNAGTPADPGDDYILIAGGLDQDPDRLDVLTGSVVKVATASFAPTTVGALPQDVLDLQAVTLADGRVAFIMGRNESGNGTDEIRIFDADGNGASQTFDLVADGRWNHRAVFVPDGAAGAILVTGGRDGGGVFKQGFVFDVATGSETFFTSPERRQMHTLTFLDNGTPGDFGDDAAIETGGLEEREEDLLDPFRSDDGDLDSVDVYQVLPGPSVAITRNAARLPTAVFFHSAAANAQGTLAVVSGGFRSIFIDEDGDFEPDFVDSDPVRNGAVLRWFPATTTLGVSNLSLRRERAMHASAGLPDGRVVVTGGINDDLNSNEGAEIVVP